MATLPFLVIPLDLGTVATGNERTEKPASHLGIFQHIGMTWKSNGASNLWVRGNLGAAKEIDFISLIHANAQSGTTIRVRLGDNQTEVDGTADYDSTALPFISPSITRDDGLYSSHLELPSVQTKQWFRIDIGSHSGDFEAAKLVIGKKRTVANYYSSGFEFGAQFLGSFNMTQWGVPDIVDGLTFRTLRYALEWMSETEFEATFRPLMESGKIGKSLPSFICFDPTANAYRQARSYFGWMKDDPAAAIGKIAPGRHGMGFNMLSMV